MSDDEIPIDVKIKSMNVSKEDDAGHGTDSDVEEINEDFDSELCELPHVSKFIHRLKKIILRQQIKIQKLSDKLQIHKTGGVVGVDVGVQTENEKNLEENKKEIGWENGCDIAEEVKQVAENALMTQAGMVYEPTSGMYYDYKSGFYYNADLRMYYDGNSGRYLVYDEITKQYSHQDVTDTGSLMEKDNEEPMSKKKKLDRVKEVDEDKEAGELSDSSSDSSENESIENADHIIEKSPVLEEVAATWPPCLRLMVQATNAAGVKVGQLFIVTCDGGVLGREGDVSVLIPETAVSKVHLRLSYIDDSYQVVDVGSRNGTWINDKRMSAALQESEPLKIVHGDSLRVGSTTLSVHVHAGQDTCDGCEPGLQLQVQEKTCAPLPASVSMRSLKKRFGVNKERAAVSTSYNDRAEQRRTDVGSSHPAEKTEVACVQQSIPAANKGFKMLEKMGWKAGNSLGKNEEGIKEPVPMISNEGSTGLGAVSANIAPNALRTAAAKRKLKMLKITHERFNRPPKIPENVKTDET